MSDKEEKSALHVIIPTDMKRQFKTKCAEQQLVMGIVIEVLITQWLRKQQ